jgi:hypothetical protein
MKEINELIRSYKPLKYEKKGNSFIISTRDNKYVVNEKPNNDIYNYLNSRSFKYYPKVIDNNRKYQVVEYIDSINMPNEQKMLDMIDLVSLLHNKTTYFKNIDPDDYKKIYEDVSNNIEHLSNYYNDLITIIESKVYPSPSEQIIENNISKIFACLNYAIGELDKWLEIIKNKTKQRFVLLHNNLDLNHFIKNDNSYLIGWNKSKIDIPIFDIYKLYKKYELDYNFESILKRYEMNYPLLEEERMLLFILISLPDKIEFENNEYNNTINVNKMIDSIYETERLLKEYSKTKKENKTNKQI